MTTVKRLFARLQLLNAPGLKTSFHMASSTQAESSGQPKSVGLRSPQKAPRSKQRRIQPNIFISIPVNDTVVHRKALEVQDRFIEAVPMAKKYMESTRKHHITLSLSAVDDSRIPEISAHFTKAIKEIVSSPILSDFRSTKMHIKGIDHFDSHRVVFCKVSAIGFNLDDLFNKLNELLESAAYPILHRPEFSAHMTLFKTKGKAKFTSADWKEFRKVFNQLKRENPDFGIQDVKEIELLHMMLPKDDNGYYAKLATSLEGDPKCSKQEFDELHKDCCARDQDSHATTTKIDEA